VTTGIVVFAHGSIVEPANESVRAVARELVRAGGYELVEVAFLGPGSPTLPEVIPRLIERGAARILVVPYFLTLGIHLERDLPQIVRQISAAHHSVSIEVTPPLDGHPALTRILLDRVHSALGRDSPAA
jgi:sirohydrochlorin ferrochelatase